MNYSYQVKVQFSNKVELSGQSVIVTEDEAAQLTTVDKVIEMLESKRSAVFQDLIKRDGFTTNSSAVSRKTVSRTHDIQLEAGTSGDNLQNKTVHLVVVKMKVSLPKIVRLLCMRQVRI